MKKNWIVLAAVVLVAVALLDYFIQSRVIQISCI